MTIPNFFILGAPKCGTTALAQWLGEHPNIYMSPVKEPHFYSTDLKNKTAIRTAHQYKHLFDGAGSTHKAIGEASVWYLYSKNAVLNILDDLPDAKFIVCLRNPVEMAYSLHGQHLKSSNEHIADFRQAWEAQTQRKRGGNVRKLCTEPSLLLYGPACSLGEQVERLQRCVRKEKVLYVLLDDLKNDPGACYRNVLDFIGVQDDQRTEFPVINAASRSRNLKVAALVKWIVGIRNALHVPRLGVGLLALHKRWNSEPSGRPPMDDQMRAELHQYFAKDIERLQILVNRDLGAWLDSPDAANHDDDILRNQKDAENAV